MYSCCKKDISLDEVQKFGETLSKDGISCINLRSLSIHYNHLASSCQTVCEYLIGLCREYKLLPNERVSILSLPDSKMAVQLAMSSFGKSKEPITYEKLQKVSSIIQNFKLTNQKEDIDEKTLQIIQTYNDLLKLTNQLDVYDVCNQIKQDFKKTGDDESDLTKDLKKIKIFCFGEPTSDLERSMMKLLCVDNVYEVIKDGSGEIITSQREITWFDSIEYHVTLSQDIPLSTSQLYIERVFICYMELLVNTRSELSLATVFNVPDRELGHMAFTALKHTAQKKKLPMYQTAVSHIIKLRLGGKAYNPLVDTELAPFVKGLGDLVTFIQKLQCIVEEETDIRAACRKVISSIKTIIKKCKTRRLKEEDLEKASEILQDKLTKILDDREQINTVSPDKPASDGGSLLGRRTVRVLRQLLDADAASKGDNCECFLEDFSLNPTTPTRIPCLLSQFRSPDIKEIEEEEELNKKQTKKRKLGLQDNYNHQDYSSIPAPKQIETTKEDKQLRENLKSVTVIPSKTIVHAAPGNTGLHLTVDKTSSKIKTTVASLDKENITESQQPIKRQKLGLNKEISNENLNKSPVAQIGSKKIISKNLESKKSKTQAKPKSCRRKLLPQVKGQQNITSFFRL